MTYDSIMTSMWVWAAAAFLGAALGLVVFGLIRFCSRQSREEEAAEAATMLAEREARRREREALWLAKTEESRAHRHIADPRKERAS